MRVKKLFIFYVVVVAYFTLYPWTFLPLHEHSTILEGLRPPIEKAGYLDIVVNLCFYVPLGALGVLGWWKGSSTASRWIVLVAFGAALSLVLETIQAWVPGRDSSLLDILTNTIGTIAGARLGIALDGRLPTGLLQGLRSPLRPMPAVLIVAWLVSEWFPFLPILRISQFSDSLHALVQVSSLGWVALVGAFVTALLVGRLLRETLTFSAYTFALVGACLVLPARLFLVVGATPWPLAAAFAAGLLVFFFFLIQGRATTQLLAAAVLLLIAVRELEPFRFVATPESFRWIPFSSILEATPDSAIRVTAGKFFLYGSAVWMVRESGASLRIAAGIVALVLIAGEFAQCYLPGRMAESTDPVLAVIAVFVMIWLKDRAPAATPLPIPRIRDRDRHGVRQV